MATIDGHNSRQRGKRLQVAAPLGSFAPFKTSSRTLLVMVVGHTFSWDEPAASHDIQSDRAFSDSFWHIARLYHRCRRMGGTEAPDPRHGPMGLELWLKGLIFTWRIFEATGPMTNSSSKSHPVLPLQISGEATALLEWIKLEGYYYYIRTTTILVVLLY